MIGWEAGVSNLASVFFFDRKLGLERWLPPRAFVLGVFLSALFLVLPSFFLSCCSLIVSFFVGGVCLSVYVLLSALCVFSLLVFVVLLPLAVADVVGGFPWRGWLCMLRCLCLFFCFTLLQRKPERCSLVHAMLASSSRCPVLLLLVHLLCMLCLFVFYARARVAMANSRLKLNVLLRRSPGDSSPPACLLLAFCSTSPPLYHHG